MFKCPYIEVCSCKKKENGLCAVVNTANDLLYIGNRIAARTHICICQANLRYEVNVEEEN